VQTELDIWNPERGMPWPIDGTFGTYAECWFWHVCRVLLFSGTYAERVLLSFSSWLARMPLIWGLVLTSLISRRLKRVALLYS
jgi:hypothetical protein